MTRRCPVVASSFPSRCVELHPHAPSIRAVVHLRHRLDPAVLVRSGGVLDDGDLGLAHRLLGGDLLRRTGAFVDEVRVVGVRVGVRTVRRKVATDPAVGPEKQHGQSDDDGEDHIAPLERQPVEAGPDHDRIDERREKEKRTQDEHHRRRGAWAAHSGGEEHDCDHHGQGREQAVGGHPQDRLTLRGEERLAAGEA